MHPFAGYIAVIVPFWGDCVKDAVMWTVNRSGRPGSLRVFAPCTIAAATGCNWSIADFVSSFPAAHL